MNQIPRILPGKKIMSALWLLLAIAWVGQGCGRSNKVQDEVELDKVTYRISEAGVGYDASNDKLDTSQAAFVAYLRISNGSSQTISFDSSNFKLKDMAGNNMPFLKSGKETALEMAQLYQLTCEPGKGGEMMLMFSVPGEGPYDLHIISPISKAATIYQYRE
jgi:hypothetical protein